MRPNGGGSTEPPNIIAIRERSAGNETVGTQWLEAKTFYETDTLSEVIEWGEKGEGRIILTRDKRFTKKPRFNRDR